MPEPDWSPATVVNDTISVGGVATWKLIGWTPETIVTRGPGDGQSTVDMSWGNVTLTDAQAASAIINPDASATATSLTFPTPLGTFDCYQRTIRNTCTAAGDVTAKLAAEQPF